MDGACKAAFPLIQEKAPHVLTFICPAHSIDNFMKNVFSDKPTIRVKGLDREFDWGGDVFGKCADRVWDVVKFIKEEKWGNFPSLREKERGCSTTQDPMHPKRSF